MQGPGVADCTYLQHLGFLGRRYVAGCRHRCRKTKTITLCCPGYWGLDCNGHKNAVFPSLSLPSCDEHLGLVSCLFRYSEVCSLYISLKLD